MLDTARVTVTVYCCVVDPSCAVTNIVIVFDPTVSGTDTGAPLTALFPFNFTVAVVSVTVGVTSIELTPLPTLAV
ncbi:hypothetical protein D3C78_1768810 [compost metagenome]